MLFLPWWLGILKRILIGDTLIFKYATACHNEECNKPSSIFTANKTTCMTKLQQGRLKLSKASGTNTARKGLCIVDSALGVRDEAGDLLGSFPAFCFLWPLLCWIGNRDYILVQIQVVENPPHSVLLFKCECLLLLEIEGDGRIMYIFQHFFPVKSVEQ